MAASTALESVLDVESFINEYYGAWSGTDEERIMSYYTDNVVLQIPGTIMEGKEAVRQQFVRPFITAFPGNRYSVKNMIFAPGVAVVEFSFEARHQGPFAVMSWFDDMLVGAERESLSLAAFRAEVGEFRELTRRVEERVTAIGEMVMEREL